MHRAVITLLVGMMLSLGGAANALTFKSDGSVVQKDGRIIKEPKTQNTRAKPVKSFSDAIDDLSDKELCLYAAVDEPKRWSFLFPEHVETAKVRGLTCGVREIDLVPQKISKTASMPYEDDTICFRATYGIPKVWNTYNLRYVEEAAKRGLSCDVDEKTVASPSKTTPTENHILMTNKVIDANEGFLQSSQIVRVHFRGDFRGKKGDYTKNYFGFATANNLFVFRNFDSFFSDGVHGFTVFNGSLNTKSTTQVLKGWDFTEKKGKKSFPTPSLGSL